MKAFYRGDFLLEHERHQIIIDLLKEKNTVKLQELVGVNKEFRVHDSSGFSSLEEGKNLKRVHGGAARFQGKLTKPMIEKSSKNVQEKHRIAKYAASLVEEGDSIYIDAGSTIGNDCLPSEKYCGRHKWTYAYRKASSKTD